MKKILILILIVFSCMPGFARTDPVTQKKEPTYCHAEQSEAVFSF